MVYLPSMPDTLWYGCGSTTMNDFIQPCTSHLILNGVISALSKCLVETMPCTGWPSLNAELTTGMAWMLCSVASLFLIWMGWLTSTACTCGWYWQPCWSMTAGGGGGFRSEERRVGKEGRSRGAPYH